MLLSPVLLRLTGYQIHALFFFFDQNMVWLTIFWLFQIQISKVCTWLLGVTFFMLMFCVGDTGLQAAAENMGQRNECFSLRPGSCCCWQRIWRHKPSCCHSSGMWWQEFVWDQASWLEWSLILSPPFLLAFEMVTPNSGSCWTFCVAQPGLELFYPLAFTSQVPGPQMWPPWLGIAGFLFSQESSQQALCSKNSALGFMFMKSYAALTVTVTPE